MKEAARKITGFGEKYENILKMGEQKKYIINIKKYGKNI